ncbi:hypothetical protein [Burkholderia multivorans]|uniref:hypothetical protein n=1 Tax=Burkholderia multivorans TaxID=87883 RepID=UPI0021C13695|nr:hypothetical protein [Burkholderia multivorans]
MKPLHLAVIALSLAAAVAHAQPAPADVPQQATRAESMKATGRVDRSQSNPEDPNACVGPVSFCNVYFGS